MADPSGGTVLVTGGKGQLGLAFARLLEGAACHAPGHAELDVTDRDAVRQRVHSLKPALLIHAAALTDTRLCEEDPALAFKVNAAGTRNVATAAEAAGAVLVLISTNEVFDGRKRKPYREEDPPNPLNVYARSKEAAEREAMTLCSRLFVVRTSWLYGDGTRNFPFRVLRLARQRCRLEMVSDEVSTPTWAGSCAEAVLRLVRGGAPHGVYHLAARGSASRYEWALEILRLASLSTEVTAVTTRKLKPAVVKPRQSVLDCGKAAALGVSMPDWREDFGRFMASAEGARLREAALA